MADDLAALLNDSALAHDVNVQEVVIRRLHEAQMTGAAAADAMFAAASRALGIPVQRLVAICELDDTIDRRQALKARTRRLPATRLPDETIYPESGWIGGYLRWCEYMEVPLAWHFWAGLTILAACCRRNFYTHSGAYPVWPSIYTVLVGPSGEGKSLCLQSAARPMLDAVNRKLKATRDDAGRIDDTINIVPDRVTVATFLDRASIGFTVGAGKEVDENGKTTRVKAERWRRRDSATVIIKDELCAFIGRDSVDAGAWIELMLDISNGQDTYVNPTQAKTRTLEGVSLTCLFGSAEENLRKGMPPTFLQGGMMGRCMWVHRLSSNRTYATLAPLDPLIREDLAGWLVNLTRQPSREILRHRETEDWWEAFYADWALSKDVQPEFRSWHNRMKDQVLRVSMLLALSNGRFTIRLSDMELAKAVLDCERDRYAHLFGVLSLTRDGELNDLVLSAIHTSLWTRHDTLANKLRRHINSVQQLDKTLELLVATGAIELQQKMLGKKVINGYRKVAQRRAM